jgi:hypothetical protein
MKRICMATVICCFVFGASLSFGQSASRQRSKKSSCNVGDITFVCPKGFKPLPVESDRKFSLLFRKEYGLGLFVALPESGFDEQKFMSDVTKTTLAQIFPKESQAFAWKPLNFSDSVSKYEVGGGMAQGFNGALSVLVKYRHLKFKDKDILVGYVAEFGRGAEAKESFERGLGGDSMPACNASVEVIYAITGEKVDENNPPCTLVVPVG